MGLGGRVVVTSRGAPMRIGPRALVFWSHSPFVADLVGRSIRIAG